MIRWTIHHPAVFVLTFSSYALLHVVRKTLSFVKGNIISEWTPATSTFPSPSSTPSASSTSPSPALSWPWTRSSLFEDQDSAEAFLGVLDAVFLFVYSVALYFSGMLADRVNLRLMLSLGMFLSALTTFVVGPVLEWTSLAGARAWLGLKPVYVSLMVLNGVFQSTGWPCVVAVMGNWFGRNSRGFILGVWSASPSVGSIAGALMAAAALDYGYEYAFIVTSSALFVGSVVVFFGLVTSPLEVGLPMADEDDDDDDGEEEKNIAKNDVQESEEIDEGGKDVHKYDRRRRKSISNMLYTPGWVSFEAEPRVRRESVVSISFVRLPDSAKRRPSLPVSMHSSVWMNRHAEPSGVEEKRRATRRYSVFDMFTRRLSITVPPVVSSDSGVSETSDDQTLIVNRGEASTDGSVDENFNTKDDREEKEAFRREGVSSEHVEAEMGCDNFGFDDVSDECIVDKSIQEDDRENSSLRNTGERTERDLSVEDHAHSEMLSLDDVAFENESSNGGILGRLNQKTDSNEEDEREDTVARSSFAYGQHVPVKNNEGHDPDGSTDYDTVDNFICVREKGRARNRRVRLDCPSVREENPLDKHSSDNAKQSDGYRKHYDCVKANGAEETAICNSPWGTSVTNRLRSVTESSVQETPNEDQELIELTNLGASCNVGKCDDDDKTAEKEETSHILDADANTNGQYLGCSERTNRARNDSRLLIDVTELGSGVYDDDSEEKEEDEEITEVTNTTTDTTTSSSSTSTTATSSGNTTTTNNKKTSRPKAISFFRALLLPGVIPYSLAYACLKMVNYVFFFWLPFYLSSAYGWPQSSADRLSVWYDVGGVVSGTIAGVLANRFQKRALVVAPMLVLAVPSLYVYGSIGATDMVTNSVMLAILGAFIGGVANIISAAISADLGRQDAIRGSVEALSTVTGIIEGTGTFGAALGQVAVPYMNSAFGWLSVFYFMMVAISLTVFNILPIIVAEVKEIVRSRRELSEC